MGMGVHALEYWRAFLRCCELLTTSLLAQSPSPETSPNATCLLTLNKLASASTFQLRYHPPLSALQKLATHRYVGHRQRDSSFLSFYWNSALESNPVQFSSAQFLDRLDHKGSMRDDLAEIFFQSFLQEALVSSSGMGRYMSTL